jgi:hypothetical protein
MLWEPGLDELLRRLERLEEITKGAMQQVRPTAPCPSIPTPSPHPHSPHHLSGTRTSPCITWSDFGSAACNHGGHSAAFREHPRRSVASAPARSVQLAKQRDLLLVAEGTAHASSPHGAHDDPTMETPPNWDAARGGARLEPMPSPASDTVVNIAQLMRRPVRCPALLRACPRTPAGSTKMACSRVTGRIRATASANGPCDALLNRAVRPSHSPVGCTHKRIRRRVRCLRSQGSHRPKGKLTLRVG